jgi:hypothetical protein
MHKVFQIRKTCVESRETCVAELLLIDLLKYINTITSPFMQISANSFYASFFLIPILAVVKRVLLSGTDHIHLNFSLLLNFKASPNVQQTYPLISLEAIIDY